MGNKFGWHSGVLTCKDAKIQGDLYVQDDIVFSDVSAGVLGVTGGIDMQSTVSAIGIDLGGTFSTVAVNIDGTCLGTTSSAIQVTLNYDFSTAGVGENYPSAIRLDLTQTAVGATEAGGFYGVQARLHAAYGNLGTYGLFSRCYITATGAANQINDVVGVMGEIRLNGTDTKRYASTSSIVALKGSISNSSTGAWDGQVFALMLDFGASANFGSTTALIYAYTHADVNCDYGFVLNNYSPNMTTGLWITETSGASPAMTACIDIDASCSDAVIRVGVTGGTAYTLLNSNHALAINTSHSAVTGTVRSAEIIQEQLVADASIINEVLYVNFDSSVSTGDWANAIVGRINFTAPGNANGGMAAAICSELSLPAAAQSGGMYYSLDVELDCPASFTCSANAALPVAMQKFGVWGDSTAITSFEDGGYLFHLDGFTAGNDKIFATVGDVAAAGTLRINIGGTAYYIMIASATS